jgi:hypothetical protein
MPWAEVGAGPAIESAGLGMFNRQDRDSDGERDEEEDGGEKPEEDRAGAGVSGGSNPARADDAGDGEEREIAESEFTLKVMGCQLMSSVMRSASFGTTTGRLPKFGWTGQSPCPFNWPV